MYGGKETGYDVVVEVLGDAAKEHQSDPSFYLIVAMYGGKEAGYDVVVEVLVLGHLVHALPLVWLHFLLHGSCRLWFVAITAKLCFAIRRHSTCKECHPVMEVSHSKTLQAFDALRLFTLVSVAGLCLSSWQVESSNVWNNNQSPCELCPVSSLGGLDGLSSEHNLNSSWDATSRQLCLHFLDPNLLEVNETGLVDVEQEPGPVVANGVPAGCRLSVLELLLNSLHHSLAVEAGEGSTDQFRMDRVSSDYLSLDLGQRSNLLGRQLSHLA